MAPVVLLNSSIRANRALGSAVRVRSRHRVSFAARAARGLHVGAFLGIVIGIVSRIVIMVPSCTVELNKLMNELEISELVSELEVSSCLCERGSALQVMSIVVESALALFMCRQNILDRMSSAREGFLITSFSAVSVSDQSYNRTSLYATVGYLPPSE